MSLRAARHGAFGLAVAIATGCGGASSVTDARSTGGPVSTTTIALVETTSTAVVATAAVPAASAAQASAKPANDEDAKVKAAVVEMLDLLARGRDAEFIEKFAIAEEMPAILDGKDRDELVRTFREDKHERVTRMLRGVATATPTKLEASAEPLPVGTLVSYEIPNEKRIVFLVTRTRVMIKN